MPTLHLDWPSRTHAVASAIRSPSLPRFFGSWLLLGICLFWAESARAQSIDQAALARETEHTAALIPGWDIFSAPLASGQVRWSISGGATDQKHFVVSYELRGTEPNHRYTAGVHFFEPSGQSLPEVNEFGGWKVSGRGGLTRDNVNATITSTWDFGTLATDARGNCTVRFEYDIPVQSYYMQFTVRTGECQPAQGITGGCSVVYRTGRRIGDGFEVITADTRGSNGSDGTNPSGGGSPGSGLRGEYFANRDLSGTPAFTRIDPTVEFKWDNDSPDPRLPNDRFSVRWTGQIQPRFSESYVIRGRRDDGLRIWIDGQPILDEWNLADTEYTSRPVTLTANHKHDIRIEYFENEFGAAVSLRWRSSSQPEEVVPTQCLFPATNTTSGPIGVTSAHHPGPQMAIPLKLFWSSGRQDNYTTTESNAAEARSKGYGEIRAEGYILAQPASNAVLLKTYYNAQWDDYVSVAHPDTEARVKREGYVFVRNEGYVYASAKMDTVPLKQYWNKDRTDYQAAATAEGNHDAGVWGYEFVRVEAYILPDSKTPIP